MSTSAIPIASKATIRVTVLSNNKIFEVSTGRPWTALDIIEQIHSVFELQGGYLRRDGLVMCSNSSTILLAGDYQFDTTFIPPGIVLWILFIFMLYYY